MAKTLRVVATMVAVVWTMAAWAGAWQSEHSDTTTVVGQRTWTGAMTAGQTLTVKNISGDIRVEPASGNEAQITAVKSGPDADQVEVQITQGSNGVLACTIYPGYGNTCDHSHSSGNIHARVNYTVHLPKNVFLRAANVNGPVEAEDLASNAEVSSVNGSVTVSTSGWAKAQSVNGSVHATLGNANWPNDLGFQSVNGSVVVTLPADANTDVRFSTMNGRVTSDFAYTVSEGTEVGGHGTHVEGRIGSGGRSLSLESINGSLELRKQ